MHARAGLAPAGCSKRHGGVEKLKGLCVVTGGHPGELKDGRRRWTPGQRGRRLAGWQGSVMVVVVGMDGPGGIDGARKGQHQQHQHDAYVEKQYVV